MELVPKDSRYIPLTQQRWCCVPTCIQMVLYRHGIPLIPAEIIGYNMGLIVPEEEVQYFWNGRTGKRPPAGWGTQAGKPQYAPNAVFKKLNIPLKMSWSLISKFKSNADFRTYLGMVEEKDRDVLVCYDWPTLFDPENKDHWGHVCVLDKVDLKNDTVRIVDPEYRAPKWRVIKIEDLYEAMKVHGDKKSGGFWELSKK